MTKQILLFLGILAAFGFQTTQAQTRKDDEFTKRLVVNRINLQEKANRTISLSARVLLNAYYKGYIKGYYPNTVDAPMPFNNFARHFKLHMRQDVPNDPDFPCCSQTTPGTGSDEKQDLEALKEVYFAGFENALEFVEYESFDKSKSMKAYDIQYIRLVWMDPEGQLPTEYAVSFKYSEIKELLAKVKMNNPYNDAAKLSIAQLFKQREFTCYNVVISGQVMIDLQEAKRRKQARIKKESELYSR